MSAIVLPVSVPVSKRTYIYSGTSLHSVASQSTITFSRKKSLVTLLVTRLYDTIYCSTRRRSLVQVQYRPFVRVLFLEGFINEAASAASFFSGIPIRL